MGGGANTWARLQPRTQWEANDGVVDRSAIQLLGAAGPAGATLQREIRELRD